MEENEIKKEDMEHVLENLRLEWDEKTNTITNSLDSIDSNIQDINDNIEEYLVINNQDPKEDKGNTEEKKEETKATKGDTKSLEEDELLQEYLNYINDNQLVQIDYMYNYQNLLIVNLFSNGILIGVMLLTLFWNRYFK